jgi:hypothetical protein
MIAVTGGHRRSDLRGVCSTVTSGAATSEAGRLFRTLRGGLNRCGVAWTGSRWLAVART